ncbi:MAG TPA: universal stress protein [Streptosporangiaceae bacterium]|nr:universal stress protein [Streptosporangiaceae bacterium]
MGRTAADAAPRRILVGVAGSAASVAAVTWAAREAALRGAVLHAVHAWEPAVRGRAPYAPGLRGLDRSDERKTAGTLLRAVVQEGLGAAPGRLAGAGSLDGAGRPGGWLPDTGEPLLEVVEGAPVQVLLHCAAGADLLVLGGTQAEDYHYGRPATDLGPVARACLRAAPCPVVTVAPHHVRDAGRDALRKLVGALG